MSVVINSYQTGRPSKVDVATGIVHLRRSMKHPVCHRCAPRQLKRGRFLQGRRCDLRMTFDFIKPQVQPRGWLLPQAQARIAARPKRTFEDPETLTLTERCLVGNPPIGGSAATPPLLPGLAFANYFQIVQTDHHVMIFSEMFHD